MLIELIRSWKPHFGFEKDFFEDKVFHTVDYGNLMYSKTTSDITVDYYNHWEKARINLN